MATVHFTKYNYKWFIHSQGRASVSAVQATCPLLGLMSLIQSLTRARKELASTSALGLVCFTSVLQLKTKNCVTKLEDVL